MGGALLRAQGLGKRYGRVSALAGLDLELEAGAPIALVGPNGAGKTTLLSLVAGFTRATAGTLSVLGERPGSGALVGRLAALPQDARLDPRLALGRQLRAFAELQGLSPAAARREVGRVLERVGLAELGGRRPDTLSHGMAKRALLAQALIGEPELVLLDEPTAGIDPEQARAIRALVAEGATRATFIVSSHNLDELERMCASVVQLGDGRLLRHETLAPGPAPLTLHLVDVPETAFRDAALGLDGVRALAALPDGGWRIESADATRTARALLALLAERGWRWRRIAQGPSLEERLYGQD